MSEYLKILAQIAVQQKKADLLLCEEKAKAIKTATELIHSFGISSTELRMQRLSVSDAADQRGRKATKGDRGRKVPDKYCDALGNRWSGRGIKPRWLTAAMAAGATLESLRVPD